MCRIRSDDAESDEASIQGWMAPPLPGCRSSVTFTTDGRPAVLCTDARSADIQQPGGCRPRITRRRFRRSHSKKSMVRSGRWASTRTGSRGKPPTSGTLDDTGQAAVSQSGASKNNMRATRRSGCDLNQSREGVSHGREAPIAVVRAGRSLLTPHSRRP